MRRTTLLNLLNLLSLFRKQSKGNTPPANLEPCKQGLGLRNSSPLSSPLEKGRAKGAGWILAAV